MWSQNTGIKHVKITKLFAGAPSKYVLEEYKHKKV